MSARCHVGCLNIDGTVTWIYIHTDGYPSCVGRILVSSWSACDRLKTLFALGNLERLGEEIGDYHRVRNEETSRWCLAFARDRGESRQEAKIAVSIDDFIDKAFMNGWAEYAYLFDQGGRWSVKYRFPANNTRPFLPIDEFIARDSAAAAEDIERR